jgi:hypothetical protein
MGTYFTQRYSTVSEYSHMCMLIMAHSFVEQWFIGNDVRTVGLHVCIQPLCPLSQSPILARSEVALDLALSIVSDGSRIWTCRPNGFTYLTPVLHTMFCLSQAIGVFSLTYST